MKLNDHKLLEQAKGPGGSYVDALEFATVIRASVDPAVELAPVADRFRLASGRINLSADRLDVHRLTISLSIPIKDIPDKATRERAGEVGTGDWETHSGELATFSGLERYEARNPSYFSW